VNTKGNGELLPKTAIFMPTKPLDLLLDFVNVKVWSKEELRHLQTKHGLAASIGGQERGYDDYVNLQHTEGHFLLDDEPEPLPFLAALGYNEPAPHWRGLPRVREDVFFSALLDLQEEWRTRLKLTSEHGPDIVFLNEIAAPAKWMVVRTANPFAPTVGPFGFHPGPLDKFLEFRFLDATLTQGDNFRKLRMCENPTCGKMFLHNRPKQKFCEDACRRRYHNRKMIETGYLRDHQQRKRDAGDERYMK